MTKAFEMHINSKLENIEENKVLCIIFKDSRICQMQNWFKENDSQIKPLLETMRKKKKIKPKISNNNLLSLRSQYISSKRTTQKKLHKMKISWWTKKTQELEQADNSRELYDNLQGVFGKKKMVVQNYSSPK